MPTHKITHKITIDIPSREAWVYEVDAPNQFANYSGSKVGMDRIANILNGAMGRMEDTDRVIPLMPEEKAEIRKITGDV